MARRLRPHPQGRWWAIWMLLFGLCACWQTATPFGIGPDESNQLIRAAGVVRGQVFTPTVPNGLGLMWQTRLPAEYGKVIFDEACFAYRPRVPASCASIPAHGPTQVTWTPFGTYPLTYYALAGWPTYLSEIRWADLGTHLLTAAISAALLASAFLAALEARRRRLLLGLALAVTPAVLYQVGAVNPSALTIAAALAGWTSLAVVATAEGPPTRRQCLRVAVCLGLLAVARPDSLLWLAAVVLVCALLAGRRRVLELARLRRVQVAALAVGLTAAAAVGWTLHADYPHTTAWTSTHLGHAPLLSSLAQHFAMLPRRAPTLLTSPGTNDLALPLGVELAWAALVGALVVNALLQARWHAKAAVLASVAAALLLPAALEAVGVNLTGYFWQMRYSLPVVVGLPVVAALATERVPGLLRRPTWLSLRRAATATAIAFVVAVQLYAFYQSLHRYTVGSSAAWNHLSGAGAWAPPLPARWLLVLFLGLDLLLVAAIWLPRRGGGRPDAAWTELAGRAAGTPRAAAPGLGRTQA